MTHKDITQGLIWTSRCSSVGLICFCIVGIVASYLTLIPEIVRLIFIVIGAIFVAVGAEGGSLYSIAAAFERDGTLHGWDWIGAFVSQLATLSTVIMAFATMTGAANDWAEFVLVWGYIATTAFVSLDATFNYMALGLHLHNEKNLLLSEARRNLEYQRNWIVMQRELVQIEREKFILATQQELYNEEKKTGPMEPLQLAEDKIQQATQTAQKTQQPAVVAIQKKTTDVQLPKTPTNKHEQIVQLLHNNGHSLQQIADAVGCSYEYVRKIKAEMRGYGNQTNTRKAAT